MNSPLERLRRGSDQGTLTREGAVISNLSAENLLRHMATSESLDSAAQYDAIIETLVAEVKRSVRTRRSFAVLLFGLNGMSQINDRYGIETGDRAVFRLARMFEHFCRSIDTAVRYRDGEFVIVLPETGPRGADQVALRIREGLANDREEPLISASVGIAIYPEQGKFVPDLIQSVHESFSETSQHKESRYPNRNFARARFNQALAWKL